MENTTVMQEVGVTDLQSHSIFRNNLTFRKLFNISIPIGEKFNFPVKEINDEIINEINQIDIIPPIPATTNFALFLTSLVLAMMWVTYITFYNSRVVGSLVTRVANKFVKSGYVKVGSLSFSVMAGKVMFRDFAYITPDWSVRALDGYIIFRWWRAYVPKDVSEDLSHSDTRLSVQLYGFELHIYNRSHLYKTLEKKFGLGPGIIPDEEDDIYTEDSEDDEEDRRKNVATSEYILGKNWRDLIPVIKVDISTGKFVFGNRLLPTTLLLSMEEAHITYSTKPANTNLDHFMHFILCRAENMKVVLADSPKYTGLRSHDEAPRNMGDGFVVLASNHVNLYYYQDEPGLVPEREEMLTLPSGEMVEPAPPSWGIDIQCGKGTVISYGPWADRQRESLYKFFFPPDYQPLKATPKPKPGDKREPKRFDLRLSTLTEATIDILFSRDKETKAVHMNIAQGSYFELTLPWFIESSNGYTTKIKGNLLKADTTTSLSYREFLQCETLEFQLDLQYPEHWNDYQEWNFVFTVSRVTLHFVFAHKWFFQDMIEDWSGHSCPDILSFVPYTWNFKLILKEFELVSPANEYNWIDTSSTSLENAYMGVCGQFLTAEFSLPYTQFVPDTVPFNFRISGENLDLSLYLPETNTTHHILVTLDHGVKMIGRDGAVSWKRDLQEGKWRRKCEWSEGWVDCWCVPNLIINIQFTYHPVPLPGPKPQADVATPEREDSMLGPLRPTGQQTSSGKQPQSSASASCSQQAPSTSASGLLQASGDPQPASGVASNTQEAGTIAAAGSDGAGGLGEQAQRRPEVLLTESPDERFDPSVLEPDVCRVDLEVGPSVVFLYGTLIKEFMHIKENLFGEDQKYTPMDEQLDEVLPGSQGAPSSHQKTSVTKGGAAASSDVTSKAPRFDPREYRPLDVVLDITVHDLQANLVKYCTTAEPPCPFLCVEKLVFEMDKSYRETRLQLLLSPVLLQSSDYADGSTVNQNSSVNVPTAPSGPGVGNTNSNNNANSVFSSLNRSHLGNNTNNGESPTPELRQGTALLTGLQFRGHAMFSELDRDLGADTLEYAWLMELQCGNLLGKLTLPQLYNVAICLETFLYLMEDKENVMKHPRPYKICQHSKKQKDCIESHQDILCPTVNEVKYKMFRVSLDLVDLNIVEGSTAVRVQCCPLRLSTCNLHGQQTHQGFTAIVNNVQLHQYISSNVKGNRYEGSQSYHSDIWVECGSVKIGPVYLEGALATHILKNANSQINQHAFLQKHDRRTKKLWFLWPFPVVSQLPIYNQRAVHGRCACVGGASFFGRNDNGPTFFKPSREELRTGTNVALLSVREDHRLNPGYGQSILSPNTLLLSANNSGSNVHNNPSLPVAWPARCNEPNKAAVSGIGGRQNIVMPPFFRGGSGADVAGSGISGSGTTPRLLRRQKTIGKRSVPSTPQNPPSSTNSTLRKKRVSISGGEHHHGHPSGGGCGVHGQQQLAASSRKASNISLPEGAVPSSGCQASPPTTSGRPATAAPDAGVPGGRDVLQQSPPNAGVIHSPTHYSSSQSHQRGSLSSAVLVRTASLVSEALSFYSVDGDGQHQGYSGASLSSSPQSPRSGMAAILPEADGDTGAETPVVGAGGKMEDSYQSREATPSSSILLQGGQSSSTAADREASEEAAGDLHDRSSSLSRSVSSSSFMSAISEQEDFGLVNLHMQVNKPITESPLLMSSYLTHLTQLRCRNVELKLSTTSTVVNNTANSNSGNRNGSPTGKSEKSSGYEGQRMSSLMDSLGTSLTELFPSFELLEEGFSCIRMHDKEEQDSQQGAGDAEPQQPPPNIPNTPSHPQRFTWDWWVGGGGGGGLPVHGSPQNPASSASMGSVGDAFDGAARVHISPSSSDPTQGIFSSSLGSSPDSLNTIRTTVMIQFRDSVDVVSSPIMLESLQKYVEALTPTLSQLHPMAVINHLHQASLGRVEERNTLKKEKSLDLQDKVVASTNKTDRSAVSDSIWSGLARVRSGFGGLQATHREPVSRTFEKSVASSVQGSLAIPKINIMILQASVVEESCAFSALDQVRDITCVSFLALGLKDIGFRFLHTAQSKKTVQVLSQPDKAPMGKKRKSKLKRVAQLPAGNIAFESSETQLEEIKLAGSISKIHAQLRRLKNDSSLLKDAAITAIPNHRSRVFFEYKNVPELSSLVGSGLRQENLLQPAEDKQHSAGKEDRTKETEEGKSVYSMDTHPLGFNMCELGLEGVQVNVSKKSSNKEKEIKEDPKLKAGLTPETGDKIRTENERLVHPNLRSFDSTTTEVRETPDLSVQEKIPEEEGENGSDVEVVPLSELEPPPQEDPDAKLRHPSPNPDVSEKKIEEDLEPQPEDGDCEVEVEEEVEAERVPTAGKKSKSAASLHFQTIWFNFAAPPKTPIAKKIDFTKLDWNLLSTGSPAIDGWLNPVSRLQTAASNMMAGYNCRVAAIVASVMTEALEEQELHMARASKYENLTALAKTLKEDPSCQLCNVMLRYVHKRGLEEIEANLDVKVIPPLTTLHQGIVVLARQWKNVIYTPILIEYNMKTSGMKNLYQREMDISSSPTEEVEDTSDEEEAFSDLETDEETSLLKNNFTATKAKYFNEGSVISNMSYFKPSKGFARSPSHKSPNSDDILALLENGDRDRRSAVIGCGSVNSEESAAVRSAKSEKGMSGPSSPATKSKMLPGSGGVGPVAGAGGGAGGADVDEEDLYHWMKRNQNMADQRYESFKSDPDGKEKSVKIQIDKEKEPITGENVVNLVPHSYSSANAFLDAHIIFEPLLSSLGLMPQQITNLSLKNLGSQVVVSGGIDTFSIKIVESEMGNKPVNNKKKMKHLKLNLDTDGSDAFLCKKVALFVDFKKITDILKGEKPSKDNVLPLYVSRNQLKRHTSSFANFTIEVDFISQKINMPLLRLINQIVTMHLNAKETNEVLRDKKASIVRQETFRKHKKQSSSGSSASDIGSVLLRPDELSLKGSSINIMHNSSQRSTNFGGAVNTPSPSTTLRYGIKSRPISLAAKFRPNSRLAGYASLGESPIQEQQDAFIFSGGHHPLEKISEEQVTKCWKTIYYLLDLYATLPETKFIQQRNSFTQLSNTDISLLQRSRMKYAQLKVDHLKTPDVERPETPKLSSPAKKEVSFARTDMVSRDHIPLVVEGTAKISKVNLTATLSGLKLEGEINNLGGVVNYKEKTKGGMQKGVSVEAKIVGMVDECSIALSEGIPSHRQTVVKVTMQSSKLTYNTVMIKTKDKNSATLIVGPVQVTIPQHPVTLHGIMTRSTKEITSTLMEFKGTRILYKGRTTSAMDDSDLAQQQQQQGSPKTSEPSILRREQQPESGANEDASQLIKPLVMTFQLVVRSFAVNAALLPSLQAEYKMENVTSKGSTGGKAKFTIQLPHHRLSFNTKLESDIEKDASLPSEASIDLPRVQMQAEYIQDEMAAVGEQNHQKAADGSMYSKGNYFKADAEIGELDHGLTTDMLNHLVFVQKVFMKEVNEVVQKLSGADRLVPVWTEFGDEFEIHQHSETSKKLLYTISVKLKRITITATTPSNSAVRFETGTSELVLSNRIVNVQGYKLGSSKISTQAKIFLKLSLGQLIKDVIYPEAEPQFHQQAYFKTSVHLRNALEDETAAQGTSSIPDKEVILISLNRPLIFFQPVAVDRAILVWLSYKNAWEYWAEQRSNLNKEVLVATQQVIERVPITQIKEQISSQHIGTLFLQLNVTDIGVAIPMNWDPYIRGDSDTKGAIVCTVEKTSISACSAQSMVCKGRFEDLCVRFSEDFNHTLDDWKPDRSRDETLMNMCTVSDGSYEICSRTAKPTRCTSEDVAKPARSSGSGLGDESERLRRGGGGLGEDAVKPGRGASEDLPSGMPFGAGLNSASMAGATASNNPKWILNIQWQMTGVDVRVDTDIGKHLSALGDALTTLTGEEEEDESTEDSSISDDFSSDVVIVDESAPLKRQRTIQIDNLPDFVFDTSIDPATRARRMREEMIEQAKVIEDLRKLGASDATVETEQKKLSDMEAFASKDFRRDIVQKIRRQSARTPATIREKLGWGGVMASSTPATGLPVPQRGISIRSRNQLLATGSGTASSPTSTVNEEALSLEESIRARLEQESAAAAAPDKRRSASGISLSDTVYSIDDEEDDLSELEPRPSGLYGASSTSAASATGVPFPQRERKRPFFATSYETISEDSRPGSPHSNVETGTMSPNKHMQALHSIDKKLAKSEPNVDYVFDFKIFINYGKCILHTKSEEDSKKIKKERSYTGSSYDPSGSPMSQRKFRNADKDFRNERDKSGTAGFKYKDIKVGSKHEIATVFYIPGLDVKVHYASKTVEMENSDFRMSSCDFPNDSIDMTANLLSFTKRSTVNKKGVLTAWLTLQSIPEETIITPSILEFLEQVLEPISILYKSDTTQIHPNTVDEDSMLGADMLNPQGASSFPVDVIVYFHMKSNQFRFSCLPVSRVECMLTLPSLDLVFSSKRSEIAFSSDEKETEGGIGGFPYRRSAGFSSSNFNSNSGAPGGSSGSVTGEEKRSLTTDDPDGIGGGLSVTGCLSDFSMHVFHPYGGGRKKRMDDVAFSPHNTTYHHLEDRKDSLSVNVAFVKFHLSRSRRLTFAKISKDNSSSKIVKQLSDPKGKACVRFSTIVDIGKAAFIYDMRRLTEILAFPKAWYRRTLVRRLFLGELKATTTGGANSAKDAMDSPAAADDYLTGGGISFSVGSKMDQSPIVSSHQQQAQQGISSSSGTSRKFSLGGSLSGTPSLRRQSSLSMGAPPTRREKLIRLDTISTRDEEEDEKKTAQSWETLVLFAVKFKELEVGMNMGNVMGNVVWISKDFTSDGRLSIGSNGHKDLYIGLGLKASSLEAKGGIIGGSVNIGKIDTYLRVMENSGMEPKHKIGARLDVMEVRVDYMGTSVLMGRISHLMATVENEWQVGLLDNAGDHGYGQDDPAAAGTHRQAMVFVFGDLKWDQFQMLISKSTTADLLKIYYKLEEFFVQQFKSSKRVLSILEPWATSVSSTPNPAGGTPTGVSSLNVAVGSAVSGPQARLAKRSSSSFRHSASGASSTAGGSNPGAGSGALPAVSHHRHWQHVLERISGLKIRTLDFRLPTSGSILGGRLELSGQHISLACFHGINFKAKSWALFSMKEPFISFNSEAQGILTEEGTKRATNVEQKMVFSLGMGESLPLAQHVSMATVCKISRNYLYSPQFKTLSEWFSYAFKNNELDQVDRFPVLTPSESRGVRDKGQYNQTLEIIFALPCLSMILKTNHTQGERPPAPEDPRPVVVCTFVTEFEDHIFVTVDAEAFFFLHDLITSYVKEKDRFLWSQQAAAGSSTVAQSSTGTGTPGAANLPHGGQDSPAGTESGSQKPDPSGKASGNADKDKTNSFQSDWREFSCQTWHLEPTVRLQSWAGRQIEPYGVDYILQRLGFSHAKTTIPKWLQRGFMDPLDKILSVIVFNALQLVSEESEEEEFKRKKVSCVAPPKSESFSDSAAKKFSPTVVPSSRS